MFEVGSNLELCDGLQWKLDRHTLQSQGPLVSLRIDGIRVFGILANAASNRGIVVASVHLSMTVSIQCGSNQQPNAYPLDE